MVLQRLNTVLGTFDNSGKSSQFLGQRSAQFQQLLQEWPTIVGVALALHTRPHRIDRQVLKVATSSTVWAQNLQFERHRLLQKITAHLEIPLTDIHFSTAYWQLPKVAEQHLASLQEEQIWHNHPSRVLTQPHTAGTAPPARAKRTVVEHFAAWATACQMRDRSLPRCPRCQSPAPPGELSRWNMCSFCMGQQCHRF
ncbi:MAG: DciA family protein [Prochlorotrichaceae cyanobacterium]